MFAETPADIAIIGGSVFGGKTWALTYEPTRHLNVPGFQAVTFRRIERDLKKAGGIWDEAMGMYPAFSGIPRTGDNEWDFPAKSRVSFSGLQYDKDALTWKSTQICLLQFDQLEEFTEYQFWYMLSRNRSTCGVRPYVRASCNPDPDSFLREFLRWWIDNETGYAIPERSGKIRWFIRVRDQVIWADSKEELVRRYPKDGRHARSVTFILARLQDNVVGTEKDPHYESNVRALPYVEQERLLGDDRGGNWNIRAAAGLVFNRAWFGEPKEWFDMAPKAARRARGWDNAATAGAGDWTSGVKLAYLDGIYYVEDVLRGQWAGNDRETQKVQAAVVDGVACRIRLEQEPGSSGVDQAKDSIKRLKGFTVHAKPSTGSLLVRAGPFASQVQAGHVKLVRGPWNEAFLRELQAFPTKGIPDDQVSAACGAFEAVTQWPDQDWSGVSPVRR